MAFEPQELRPRFQPDWVPSWVTNPPGDITELRYREDHIRRGRSPVMDAVRLMDNKPVMLKKVYQANNGFDQELVISKYVSSTELSKHADNNCVPVYEVLNVPEDTKFVVIVMPLLHPFDTTRFDTIGKCFDFFYQTFKVYHAWSPTSVVCSFFIIVILLIGGVTFDCYYEVLALNAPFSDCTQNNVMMDPSEIYPDGFHPVKYNMNCDLTGPAFQKYTRTQRPPKYYWIDFGLSVQFDRSDEFPRAISIREGDKSVPEFQDMARLHAARDPFPTDIYYLGNLGHSGLLDGFKYGFAFMKPLVDAMVQEDMTKRPKIDQCVVHLEEIIRSQSSWTLRAQIWHSTDNPFGFLNRFLPHWARRIIYIITRTPAVPSWSSR
ncbi:hypothetical protein CVT25_000847 [Psilocybe cyanescens]|uniref:Protein kinase domain-containing protein n=1 Tax=Psilocybe cyanescens TaxID=93625 RepID=A0A409XB73_PSICY|nr:hypothetical protein CVT25_000847 [Psilocybe cyanescens]